jgi:predicted regulator of Ras-like GTPase activity (Roadblock/LC7/MglB family)
MQDLTTTLSSLRDLEGIVGSFVVSEAGDVVAKDLPAYFDGVLEEVGPRLLRLREALDMAEGDVSSCSVRYAGHKLTIRSIDTALLAVVADAKINGPALRMAMNLVIRKCSAGDLNAPSSRISSVPGHLSAQAAFPIVASGTVPSSEVTVTPNLAASTRTDGLEGEKSGYRSNGGAPEGGHSAGRKKREVLFRGKRVG